jgi:hypothetical protein
MARSISVVVMNVFKQFLRSVCIHISVLVITLFSLPSARKVLFGLVGLIFMISFLQGMNPPLSISLQNIFLNPELTAYNACIFSVIEEAPVDEEFAWRLSACGEAPSRFKWSS